MRFPFDRYKKEKWDIEHVFSQTDVELKGEALKSHVGLIFELLTGEKIENVDKKNLDKYKKKLTIDDPSLIDQLFKIYDMLNKRKSKEAEELYNDIKNKLQNSFKENNIENRDHISNLVLLDSKTNRSYHNAFFPIKRLMIINKIKKGDFVPIGTQNVFLKAYSKKFDNIMYWTEEDAENYLDAVIETFNQFYKQG